MKFEILTIRDLKKIVDSVDEKYLDRKIEIRHNEDGCSSLCYGIQFDISCNFSSQATITIETLEMEEDYTDSDHGGEWSEIEEYENKEY